MTIASLPISSMSTSLANWPIELEYMTGWHALLLWAGLSLPIVLLGIRSLAGLGPVRRWVALGTRLALMGVLVLILAGIRWQRQNEDVEVMILRDNSESILNYQSFPGDTLQSSLDKYLVASSESRLKKPDDRIGLISFNDSAVIEELPNKSYTHESGPIRDYGNGTDIAEAIQLALATFSRDAMRRIVLVSDGNSTAGDIEAAINAAASQHVPIDVMPLTYNIDHEVMMDRVLAPTWRREGEGVKLDIYCTSTNLAQVRGKLTVSMMSAGGESRSVVLDPGKPWSPAMLVTLRPGTNHFTVGLPGLTDPGVYTFRAAFEPERAADAGKFATTVGSRGARRPQSPYVGATDKDNKTASAFTVVRGKGQILYVDNVFDDAGNRTPGKILQQALESQGLNIRNIPFEAFPHNLMQLQNYDAVILNNVRYGNGGLDADQADMLATYVHDMGGGLVMIGGPDSLGAGGWRGAQKFQEILPVNLEIPAIRQMPKGALVLVMHACEMPDGNYWGEQCALQAGAALSDRDEIGVISYGFGAHGGQGIGGAQWDFPLAERGDGTKVISAIKAMQLGDMPSFDDAMTLALKGTGGGAPCLLNSNARHKHVIIISDGDPQAPNPQLMQDYLDAKVSVSTVTVYTHTPGTPSPTMVHIAQKLHGKVYGPIESNPRQLPQIFIKEATTVRRTLIQEDLENGLPVSVAQPTASELIKDVRFPATVRGMVLTARKNSPNIEVPLVVGKANDPLLAHWQTGLGKCVVFASDAHTRWAPNWVASPMYAKFWTQVVRSVSRPAMSGDFDVQIVHDKGKAYIRIEATRKDAGFVNFATIHGKIVGPDMQVHDIRLVQTGPGEYRGEFDAQAQGNYVALLNYQGKNESGTLVSGLAVNSSPEVRDLHSDEALLRQIAARTGGRLLDPWNAQAAGLFSRNDLFIGAAPLPVWDVMLVVLMFLLLLDVAIRRIAWDWAATKQLLARGAGFVRSFTTTRRVETRHTLDALRRVRDEAAEQSAHADASPGGSSAAPPPLPPQKTASAKFEAPAGVEGDITQVVGGATDKPVPPPPKKADPKGLAGGPGGLDTNSLLEAKRRARQQIKQKEEGK